MGLLDTIKDKARKTPEGDTSPQPTTDPLTPQQHAQPQEETAPEEETAPQAALPTAPAKTGEPEPVQAPEAEEGLIERLLRRARSMRSGASAPPVTPPTSASPNASQRRSPWPVINNRTRDINEMIDQM